MSTLKHTTLFGRGSRAVRSSTWSLSLPISGPYSIIQMNTKSIKSINSVNSIKSINHANPTVVREVYTIGLPSRAGAVDPNFCLLLSVSCKFSWRVYSSERHLIKPTSNTFLKSFVVPMSSSFKTSTTPWSYSLLCWDPYFCLRTKFYHLTSPNPTTYLQFLQLGINTRNVLLDRPGELVDLCRLVIEQTFPSHN